MSTAEVEVASSFKIPTTVKQTDYKKYTRSETDNARPRRTPAHGDEIGKYGVLLKCPYGLHDSALLNKIYEELESKYDRKSLWADLKALRDKRFEEMGQTSYEEGYQDPRNFPDILEINKQTYFSKKPGQESFVQGIIPCSKGWSYPEPQPVPMFAWDPEFHGQARKSLRQWIKDEAVVIDKRCADSMSACDLCKRLEASKKWHPARIPRPFDRAGEPVPAGFLGEHGPNASKDEDDEKSVKHWVSSNYPRTDDEHTQSSTSPPPEDCACTEMDTDDQSRGDVNTPVEDSDDQEADKGDQCPEEPAEENKDASVHAQLNRNNSHMVSRTSTPSLRDTPTICDVEEFEFPRKPMQTNFSENLGNQKRPRSVLRKLDFRDVNDNEDVSFYSPNLLRSVSREVSSDVSLAEHKSRVSVVSSGTKKDSRIKTKISRPTVIKPKLETNRHKFNDSPSPNRLKMSDMTRALFGGEFPMLQEDDPSDTVEKKIDSLRSVALFSTGRTHKRVGREARKSFWMQTNDSFESQHSESFASDGDCSSGIKLPTLPEYLTGNTRYRVKQATSPQRGVLTKRALARDASDQTVHTIPLHFQTLAPQVKQHVVTSAPGQTHFIISSSMVKNSPLQTSMHKHKRDRYKHVHECSVPDIVKSVRQDKPNSNRESQNDFGSLSQTMRILNKFE